MFRKNLKLLSIILVFVLCFSFSLVFAVGEDEIPTLTQDDSAVIAVETEENADAVISEDANASSWIYGDYSESGDKVVLDKIIDGNAYIIGTDVTITGEIEGDLFVLADKVTIDGGYIYSNLFVVANEVTINGIVYDLYACAKNITLGEQGLVSRDFRALSSDSITINGQINRNANIGATKSLNISENAAINGNLRYPDSDKITIPEGVVTGETIAEKAPSMPAQSKKTVVLNYVESLLAYVFINLVIAFIVFKCAPNFVDKLASAIKSPASYLWGILALFAIPLVAIILLLTRIGAKLALIICLLYLLALILASVAFNITIAKILYDKCHEKSKMITTMSSVLFTAIALWILQQIPFINVFAYLIVFIGGFSFIITPMLSCKKNK